MGVVHLIWWPLIHQRAKSLSLWIWPEKSKSISAHNSSTSLLALISYYTVQKENVVQHKIGSMFFFSNRNQKKTQQLKWSHFSACMSSQFEYSDLAVPFFYFLTFILFQTCMDFFLLFNTKDDILKNAANQTVDGPHWLSLYSLL